MKIEYINYFLEIVRARSISNAAKKLFISQQGLSKAVQCIENEFNVALFNRTSSNLSLTAEGMIFLEAATELWGSYENLRNKMTALTLSQNVGSDIQIYSTRYLSNYFFPLLYKKLEENDMKIRINYTERSSQENLAGLETISPDTLCMTNIPNYQMDEIMAIDGMEFMHIFDNSLMLKVASISPLAAKKIITRQELLQYPLAVYYDNMLMEMLGYLMEDIKNANIVFKTTNRSLITQKILSEESVGFTDSFLAKVELGDDFTAIPIQNTITMHHGFIYLTKNPPSTKVMNLMQFIKKNFYEF